MTTGRGCGLPRSRHPSDLADEQWALIAPMAPVKTGGHPAGQASRWRIVDAILYLNRRGCSWRQLPHDFSPCHVAQGVTARSLANSPPPCGASCSRLVNLIGFISLSGPVLVVSSAMLLAGMGALGVGLLHGAQPSPPLAQTPTAAFAG